MVFQKRKRMSPLHCVLIEHKNHQNHIDIQSKDSSQFFLHLVHYIPSKIIPIYLTSEHKVIILYVLHFYSRQYFGKFPEIF